MLRTYTVPRFATSYDALFRCTPTRCCINYTALELAIDPDRLNSIVLSLGFKPVDVTVVDSIRPLIGKAKHQRGASPRQAPEVIDCSLLAWWGYSQVGIQLPRYSINQRASSVEVALSQLKSGDLLFRSGWRPYYQTDAGDGVGHVGVVTERGSVIHAPSWQAGVSEETVEDFVGDGTRFRGAGRIIPVNANVVTYEMPAERILSSSLDLRCLILQHLGSSG